MDRESVEELREDDRQDLQRGREKGAEKGEGGLLQHHFCADLFMASLDRRRPLLFARCQ